MKFNEIPISIFINKANGTYTHSCIVYNCLHTVTADLSGCNIDVRVHRV